VFIYDYSKFYTVAKDVKVQVEFMNDQVEAYRLIGYENRLLNTDDFDDDEEDAGEIGATQNITALYEIIPAENSSQNELTFKINFRYKQPDSSSSTEINLGVIDEGNSFEQASDFMKFTAGVASFSMLITDSQYKGNSSYDQVKTWIQSATLTDTHNFKAEVVQLVEKAKALQ
jgi:Ca-activated chloride channel family protein